jgi:HEAT repeat protein
VRIFTASGEVGKALKEYQRFYKLGGSPSSDLLLPILKDERVDLEEIASLVIELGDQSAVPALIEILKDKNANIGRRYSVAPAVAKLGDKSAVLTLIETLENDTYLIKALTDESEYIRNLAANILEEIGEPAIPLLTKVLKHENEAIRRNALTVLERIAENSPAAVPPIIEALTDESSYIRYSAVQALRGVRQPTEAIVPALIDALIDDDKAVRKYAAIAFGEMGEANREATLALIETLGDKDREVRGFASNALIKMGKSVTPALVDALGASNEHIGANAALILSKIGEPFEVIVSALSQALELENKVVRSFSAYSLARLDKSKLEISIAENDKVRMYAAYLLATIDNSRTDLSVSVLTQTLKAADSYTRSKTAEYLRNMGSPAVSAVPTLIEVLNDEDSSVRSVAALALGSIGGDENIVPVLIKALGDEDKEVRESVVLALGRMGKPAKEAVPELVQLLEDSHSRTIRYYAAGALGKIGTPDVIPALVKALNNEDSSFNRRGIIEGLKQIGTPDVIPALIRALNDEDWLVRFDAVQALKQIGTPEALKAVEEWEKKSKPY